MSGPLKMVCQYLLLVLGLVLALRLINHSWPAPSLLGVVAGMCFFLWHRQLRLEERARLDGLGERRGKYGPRRSRA